MIISPATSRTASAAPTHSGPAGGPLRRLTFPALGTKCEVQYAAASTVQAMAFERAAADWVRAFEAKYSRFLPDSLVSKINASAGREWVEVDEEMDELLNICDALHLMTKGVLDPTALPLIRLWNFKASPPVVPTDNQIAAARLLVGWPKVQRTFGKIFLPQPGMALDFGGFGKEYAVDIVAQIAVKHDINNVLVDFGHDLKALGAPPSKPCWHVGLEDPENPGQLSGSIGITGGGVASSGDYLRSFIIDGRRYGHIIDSRTGRPVANGCTQATVVAASCLQAGVLSTTSFVLGIKDGIDFIQSFPGAEGIISAGRSRAQTRGFFNYVVTT